MNPVKHIRLRSGLSQQQLAQAAGTSQPAIAAYESGRKSPTLKTLERIAAASGLAVNLTFHPPMSREDRRSLEFHRSITRLLLEDEETVRHKAFGNLKKLRTMHPDAADLLLEWQIWLESPVLEFLEKSCALISMLGRCARFRPSQVY